VEEQTAPSTPAISAAAPGIPPAQPRHPAPRGPLFLSLGARLAGFCALLVLLTAACLLWFAHKDTILALRAAQRRTLDNVLYLLESELMTAHKEALLAKVAAVEEIKASLLRASEAAESALRESHNNADADARSGESAELAFWSRHALDPALTVDFFLLNTPQAAPPKSILNGVPLPAAYLSAAASLQAEGEGDFALDVEAEFKSAAERDTKLAWLIRRGDILIVCARGLRETEEAGTRRMRGVAERFTALLDEVQIQQSGFAAVLDSAGNLLHGPADAYIPEKLRSTLAAGVFAGAGRRIMLLPGEGGAGDDRGETLYLLAHFRPLGWNIVLAAPLREMEAPAVQVVAGQLWISLLVMAGGLILGLFFALRVSGPVRRLAGLARSLPEQDMLTLDTAALTRSMPLRRRDEVGELARSFRYMIEELCANIRQLVASTARRERMENELAVARDIQYGMLPASFPVCADVRMHALMLTAKEVGGDFYDLFLLEGDRLCFVIGDVSDKSVPAALFMSMATTLTRSILQGGGVTPDEALRRINNGLSANNPRNMFVTLCIGILQRRSGELLWASAGHQPPVRVSSLGAFPLPQTGNMVAGSMEDMPYKLMRDELKAGEALFLYTDGVTEARNMERGLYGDPRLLEVLNAARAAAPTDMVEAVLQDVRLYAGEAEQSDDITIVAIRRAD
jgi:sigma-B regulation protein RsbU (phosphoserine phosphatase)